MSLLEQGKLMLTEEAMSRMLNADPSTEVLSNGRTRIYFEGAELLRAQSNFAKMMDGEPGPIEYDLLPVVQPWALKKYGKYVIGAALLVYLVGRL